MTAWPEQISPLGPATMWFCLNVLWATINITLFKCCYAAKARRSKYFSWYNLP
jgi:hypothetical protein